MGWMPITLILFLICGIACAWFAAPRHRNQAGWFLVGCLIGPIGVLILLLLPSLPETKRKTAIGRVIAGAMIVLLLAGAIVVGAAEFWERYQEGKRYAELSNWELYGDALLRFTKSNEHPPDAIVVKAANSQIDDYAYQLREGKCWTLYDLELAEQGVRNSTGARAVIEYAARFLTLRSPEWPSPLPLSAQEQKIRVDELNKRIRQFEEALQEIDTARSDTTTTTTATN